MSQGPCQEEKEEFNKAAKEWASATEELKPYIPTQPIDLFKDLKSLSQEEDQRFVQASDREYLARENYHKAWIKYSKCMKKYS